VFSLLELSEQKLLAEAENNVSSSGAAKVHYCVDSRIERFFWPSQNNIIYGAVSL
jgi:hypothetical protein